MSFRFAKVATVLAALTLGAGTAEAQLLNADFESGNLGAWFNSTNFCGSDPACQPWSVGSGVGRNGSFGGFNRGNILLRQDLASAVAVSDISELSFWARHETGSVMARFVEYSDLTTSESIINTTNVWQKFDFDFLDPNKSIIAVGVFGVSPPDNTAFVDDWTLTSTAVPEPATLAMLVPGLLGLAVVVRRRDRQR